MNEKEAQQLLRRYQLGQCTEEEQELILRWYESLGQDIPDTAVFPNETSREQVRARLQEEITQRIAATEKKVKPIWPYYRMAAAVTLLLVAVYAIWYMLSGQLPGDTNITYHVLQVPIGQRAQVRLADSSTVWLNAGSCFRYPTSFTREQRAVYLEEGEAFFEVKRDEKKPFHVYTSQLSVQVLGTSFNVKAYAKLSDITVTVASGKVAVADSVRQLGVLTPDEALSYEKHTGKFVTQQTDAQALLAWREGQLIFQQATFAEVAQMLENKYGIQVRFHNEALQRCRFTARFQANEPLEQVLSVLSLLHQTRFSISGNQVMITGEGCPTPH